MRWNHFLSLPLILFMVFLAAPILASDKNAVLGRWASDGSIFKVYLEGESLMGQVQVIKDAVYTAEEGAGRIGEARLDDKNPDLELRKQPLVGLQMFSKYRFEGDQWQGEIYDPESGNTYQSKMHVGKNGRLEIRGYIGLPMFGRTSKFDPVSSCKPHIKVLLSTLQDEATCSE